MKKVIIFLVLVTVASFCPVLAEVVNGKWEDKVSLYKEVYSKEDPLIISEEDLVRIREKDLERIIQFEKQHNIRKDYDIRDVGDAPNDYLGTRNFQNPLDEYEFIITQITNFNNPADLWTPTVSENKIVWGHGEFTIHIYDLATQVDQQIATMFTMYSDSHRHISISGNRVVYAQDIGQSFYHPAILYDIVNNTWQTFEGYQWVDISGDNIVFERANGDYVNQVYLYNIPNGGTPEPISDINYYSEAPAISGSNMVWKTRPFSTHNYEVYLFDLSHPEQGVQQITNSGEWKGETAISGNKIVWGKDWRSNDHHEIYLYDLDNPEAGEQLIINGPGYRVNPEISGNNIVWQDDRNGNWDIYLYDLEDQIEYRVTNTPDDDTEPKISGDRIVWIRNDGGIKNIYMAVMAVAGSCPRPHIEVTQCGTIINQPNVSVVLNDDLDCSNVGETAIRIDANNVCLDCQGHTITGNDGEISDISVGVGVLGSNSQVHNCNLIGFPYGMAIYGWDNLVAQNTIQDSNAIGIQLSLAGNRIEGNYLSNSDSAGNHYGTGVYTGIDIRTTNNQIIGNDISGFNKAVNIGGGGGYFSHDDIVRDNSIRDNGEGIYVRGAIGAEISNNDVSDNDTYGIRIVSSCSNSEITNNILRRNGVAGILLNNSTHYLSNNFVAGNDIGLRFNLHAYYNDTVENNSFCGNISWDIFAGVTYYYGDPLQNNFCDLVNPDDVADCIPCNTYRPNEQIEQ